MYDYICVDFIYTVESILSILLILNMALYQETHYSALDQLKPYLVMASTTCVIATSFSCNSLSSYTKVNIYLNKTCHSLFDYPLL
jgi:hypothetical protein